MTSGERVLQLRRILVALDASPHSLAALQAAAELAAHMEAELLGMFVEDVNLLRLAELPYAQEICVSSTTCRRLDVQQIERELRAQETRVRRTLAAHAERVQVRWSFRVTRGVIAKELLTAAAQSDLITLGRAGRSLGERRLGSTTRAVLADAPCLTLIIQEGERLRFPMMVVYDGSPLAHKALTVAVSLVQGRDKHIVVFVPADDKESATRIKAQATAFLQEHHMLWRYHVLMTPDVQRLVREIQMETKGTLVLPIESAALPGDAILQLLDELEVPVLLVR